MNNEIGIKRLEDISGDETVVDAGILVFLELGELVLADIHHGCGLCRSGAAGVWCEGVGVVVVEGVAVGKFLGFASGS
jgi:hypothetical protein